MPSSSPRSADKTNGGGLVTDGHGSGLRLAHYFPSALRPSGVSAAIEMWSEAASSQGAETVLLHADRQEPSGYVQHLGWSRGTWLPLRLRRHLKDVDVLVLHEGWTFSNIVAAHVAKRARVPYVLVPHGVYEPGIMEGLKMRRPIRQGAERRVIRNASAVHVFHASEVPLVRAVSRRAAVMVFPICMSPATETWSGGGGYIAWLGRADIRHKGLDLLVDAVASMSPDTRPLVRMKIQDFKGGLDQLRTRIAQRGVTGSFRLEAPAYGEEKQRFLIDCDAYVHLSAWESMGIMLMEALALGVPTIISDTMHISEFCSAADASLVVPRRLETVVDALTEVGEVADSLSINAKALLRSRFNWSEVAPQYVEAMRRLASSGGRSSQEP